MENPILSSTSFPTTSPAIPLQLPAQELQHDDLDTSSEQAFALAYEEPLYTEISIPVPNATSPLQPPSKLASPSSSTLIPAIPSTPSAQPSPPRGRSRSCTLSSLSPFRHRRSSSVSSFSSASTTSSTTNSIAEEWPHRFHKDMVNSRQGYAGIMEFAPQSLQAGGGAIEALAVVPAVLVLRAELFTPGGVKGGIC